MFSLGMNVCRIHIYILHILHIYLYICKSDSGILYLFSNIKLLIYCDKHLLKDKYELY